MNNPMDNHHMTPAEVESEVARYLEMWRTISNEPSISQIISAAILYHDLANQPEKASAVIHSLLLGRNDARQSVLASLKFRTYADAALAMNFDIPWAEEAARVAESLLAFTPYSEAVQGTHFAVSTPEDSSAGFTSAVRRGTSIALRMRRD